MRRRALIVGLSAVALLAACEKTGEPADPVWGKAPCTHCAMLIGNRRSAAQLVENGNRRFFDDIGCMVMWIDERKLAPEHTWVHDADRTLWVEARAARFARGAKTPMDFGFEPRADGPLGWDEVRDNVLQKGTKR